MVSFILLAGLYIGLGTWVYRLVDKTRFSLGWAFWIGWAISIGMLQIWHFFAPINDDSRLVIASIGLVGMILNHRLILHALFPLSSQKLAWTGITLIIMVYCANRALYSTPDYIAFGFDTGFYHLPVMTWFNQHPIVIGLGNVHTRFGFSNAHFLYGAWLNGSFFGATSVILMNTLLYIVFLSQTTWSIIHILTTQNVSSEHVFRALCLPFVLMWLFWRSAEGLGIPSTSNDVPIFMVGILLTGRILFHIQKRDIRLIDVYTITLLVCVGIAVKFSFVILGGGWLLFSIGLFALQKPRMLPMLVGVSMIGALIILPMLTRSVIMTGYPLYPLTIGEFDVDWRINRQTALYESEHIQTFARVLGDTPMYDTLINNPDRDWLPFWLEKSSRDYPVFLYTPIGLFIIGLMLLIITKKIRVMHLVFLDVLMMSIIFWFISAPLWRLSGGVTWLFGASLVTMGIMSLWGTSSVKDKHKRRLSMLWGEDLGVGSKIVVILLFGMCAYVFYDGTQNRGFDFAWVNGEQPTPIRWIEHATTAFGLDVRVAQDWLCWDDSPPCVPKQHYSSLLKARPNGGYQLPDHAILFDPAIGEVSLMMDTLEAVALDENTFLRLELTPLDADFIPQSDASPARNFIDYTNEIEILPASLESRNNFSTTRIMGRIPLPKLPTGIYQLVAEWDGQFTHLADMWQVRNFRFGDMIRLTDSVIQHDENRVMIQLVGEALDVIPSRYHVAIWLRGENGTFQRDVSPIIPTHDWAIAERYLISAYFDNIPRGNYDLSVVWYDVYQPDLPRLNGFDEDNTPLGDDVILITDLDL